jgi:chorismate mutase
MVRGVRGASTVSQNTKEDIVQETKGLLASMVSDNGINAEDIASILFTLTPDLNAEFPAVAAREMGFSDVPLICAAEIPVSGSLASCVRILIHWNTDKPATDIQHIYIKGAATLRPDKQKA